MDDILLMAYVDGNLQPRERKEVERTIVVSADVAERVALLRRRRCRIGGRSSISNCHRFRKALTRNVAQLIERQTPAPRHESAGRNDRAAAWASRASGRSPWSLRMRGLSGLQA